MKYTVRPYRETDYEPLAELGRKNFSEWHPGQEPSLYGPHDPSALACAVTVDEADRPVAYMTARRLADIGGTIDHGVSVQDSVLILQRTWTTLGAALIKMGYERAVIRIASPTPKFGRTLEKRAGFLKSEHPHYYFNLEAVATRLKRP